MQIVPLDSSPNQSFKIVLSIDGENRSLSFKVRYNEVAGYWIMTVIDPVEDEVLIDSLPLVPGNSPANNILEQFAYLKIGSAYVVNMGNVSDDPAIDDLGVNFYLVWGDTPNG